MFKKIFALTIILFLTSCASSVVPLQPGEHYYNAKLKVKNTYVVPPTLLMLGFTFPATSYNAYMKDKNGIFFSSPTPLLGTDNLVGTVFRTGGIYYRTYPSKEVFFYIIDTNSFVGPIISRKPMNGLQYSITK